MDYLMGIDAASFETFAQGLLLLATALATVVGIIIGKRKSNGKTPDSLEVAGALVSDKQGKDIVAALDNNTAAVTRQTDVITQSAEKVHDTIIDLRMDIARLGRG